MVWATGTLLLVPGEWYSLCVLTDAAWRTGCHTFEQFLFYRVPLNPLHTEKLVQGDSGPLIPLPVSSFHRSHVLGGAGTAPPLPFMQPARLLTTCHFRLDVSASSVPGHLSLEAVTAVLGMKYRTVCSIHLTFLKPESWLPALEEVSMVSPLSSIVC